MYWTSETEKSIKIAIRIRFGSIHSIFDSIRFGLLFEIHNSVRLDSTDSIFDSIRLDSTHPQQNIVFFVLCSTYYVCVQKQWSISRWNTLFPCARVYFSQDNYSTNEYLNNQKENKHT